MNIAIMCWSFSGGGLETRLRGQIEYLKSRGHKVFCVFGNYEEVNKIKPDHIITDVKFINIKDWQFNKDSVMPGLELADTVDYLRDFIETNKIDIVDIHTDFTLFASAIAAGICNIPAVYTVHGPGGIRFLDPAFKSGNLLTYITLMKGVDRTYCVAEYLQAQCSGFLDSHILRNSVDLPDKTLPLPLNGKWAYVSRLDDFKTQPLIEILDVIKESEINHLDIYGEGPARGKLQKAIEDKELTDIVTLKGWVDDTADLAGEYDCVMGVGRVAIESGALGIPTILMSDSFGIAGVLTPETIDYFKQTNFTSRKSLTKSDNLKIINDICRDPGSFSSAGLISGDLVSSNAWAQYEKDIQTLVKKKEGPESMRQIYLMLRRSSHWVDFWNDDNLYSLLRDNYYQDVSFVIDSINSSKIESLATQVAELKDIVTRVENSSNIVHKPNTSQQYKSLAKSIVRKLGLKG